MEKLTRNGRRFIKKEEGKYKIIIPDLYDVLRGGLVRLVIFLRLRVRLLAKSSF
jgi:hypothetical protein